MNECYEGIRELLSRLTADGYDLYVATSKPEPLAVEILRRFELDSYFTIIAGATYDHTRENKEDVLRYLLEKCSADMRPVMIGDTVFDVDGARKLGIDCIGAAWGYGDPEEMEAHQAVGIAKDPEDLYRIIKNLP